ncbi:MAG: hypothetical protein HUU56_03650 [Bdellovibrionaceae bacterium]|nr:hypothetical protein [Pseudobdellovibrionaceae bacterium]
MLKNSKENQAFKSFDVLAIVFLLILGLFFYSFPFNHQNEEQTSKSAKNKAEVLGYQIAQIYKDQVLNSNMTNSRGPASAKEEFKKEGFIGADQNGKPFRYKIFEEGSKQLKVIVTNKEEVEDGSPVDTRPNHELVHVELSVPLETKGN